MTVISAIRGARDLLPGDLPRWRRAERAAERCFALYGYGEIRTPVLERAELFARQLGEHTELVEKQMYLFADGDGGDTLALRPEATVPTVRAALQSGMHRNLPARLWYRGAMFRRERPQRGRYRQFWQIGAEILGAQSPSADAEQILLTARLWRELGVDGRLRLAVNNLGDGEERARHREKLREHFRANAAEMGEDAARAETNPLRLLESRDAKTAAVARDAPKLSDELGDASRKHSDAVCESLTRAGVAFSQDETLVRGLDYYNLTVFEWSLAGDDRRQNALCGGGRYDGLSQQIGGPPMPGCGFALGLDRLVDLLAEPPRETPDCFLTLTEECAREFAGELAEHCRDAGLTVWRHIGGGNLARQLKKADAAGAKTALIIGSREAAARRVTIKRMSDGDQREAEFAKAPAQIKAAIAGDGVRDGDGDGGNNNDDSVN